MNSQPLGRTARVLAMTGAAALAISPFSFVPFLVRFALAVLTALVMSRWADGRQLGAPLAVMQPRNGRLQDQHLALGIVAVFGYAVVCSLISINTLSSQNNTNLMQVFQRSGTQLFSLCLFIFELVCGYQMARWLQPPQLRPLIVYPLAITLGIAVYQTLAIQFDLPYIGRYARDILVGLRPSALAMEPKYLSSYLAIGGGYVLMALKDQPAGPRRYRAGHLVLLLGCAYFYLTASSGNGALTLVAILLTHFVTFPSPRKIALLAALTALVFVGYSAINLDELPIRNSHKTILESLSALDILMFDDLIFLPVLAWMDNVPSVIFGFGPGLMHFFGEKYAAYATWLTDATYIEGNLSAIMYISNFGLIAFTLLFLSVASRGIRVARMHTAGGARAIDIFFLHTFVSGALVSGNISTPIYLAMGWILARSATLGTPRRPLQPRTA